MQDFVPRLGINIDHVATLRQLRGTPYPNLVDMARVVEDAGADQITIHLREDRRHIQDADVRALRKSLRVPMNLEMAVTEEMVRIAKRTKPVWSCLVPEKRQEVTTEGGLDLKRGKRRIGKAIEALQRSKIKVSLFVEPSLQAVKLSAELGAEAVELHTGRYCLAAQKGQKARAKRELERVRKACAAARNLGIAAHAGHGIDYLNVRPLVELYEDGRPCIEEYNIGHSIVCQAVQVGMEQAVRHMKSLIVAP